MQKIINYTMVCRLSEAELLCEYVIEKIELKNEKILHQLSCFGIAKNQKVKLLKYNYFNTCCLVKIMGVCYAVDRMICEGIYVSC